MTILYLGTAIGVMIIHIAVLTLSLLIYRRVQSLRLNTDTKPLTPAQQTRPVQEEFLSNEALDAEWREEVKRTVEYQCLNIRNAVFKQTVDIHQREIELAPKHFLIDRDVLVDVYSRNELAIIDGFLRSFHHYLEEHWYTTDRQLKSVFPGSISNTQSEAGKVVYRSKQLTAEFDQLLAQLRFTLPS
ncbi:hypothetical protein [Salisediminibacterium halotolerans]|uniref:Uncharacterized protein n=1 Tax=Salisediminibacterium halotolerans TaxID=517425 RepID=A0A1H9P805_9BACI|nr:hypothetical protein [Salisediminibacterium haloalkalitolerans]SER44338.1 hypothetical protein SAMN05444126_101115 [Salisediminibacterium haloalkalitolerans]